MPYGATSARVSRPPVEDDDAGPLRELGRLLCGQPPPPRSRQSPAGNSVGSQLAPVGRSVDVEQDAVVGHRDLDDVLGA